MSNIFETYPQGHWSVGDEKFINKYAAYLKSKDTNQDLKFHYFDSVWDSFDRNMLGKFSLDSLYKYRAQQLRDSYDYLILYFSGGADSYNVLRSFIDNNIHLDEVCVKWPMAVHNSNSSIYTPNTEVKDASNTLSEWDYAIKPVLDEIARMHPEIKIQIVDWLPNVEQELVYSTFEKVNVWHDLEVPIMTAHSPSHNAMSAKGKTVGAIYGIDKPDTYFDNNNAYMWFSDAATTMGVPDLNSTTSIEYFYWTPELPILAFEMARVSILWQLSDRVIFENSAITKQIVIDFKKGVDMFNMYQYRQTKLKTVLYTTWTNRYQAGKPREPDRKDKHKWLFDHEQLKTYRESYYSIANELDASYLIKKSSPTKKFLVLTNIEQYTKWKPQ